MGGKSMEVAEVVDWGISIRFFLSFPSNSLLRPSLRFCCDGMKIHCYVLVIAPKYLYNQKICKGRKLFMFQINIQLGFKRELSLRVCLEFWISDHNVTSHRDIICKVDNMTFKKATDTSFVCTLTSSSLPRPLHCLFKFNFSNRWASSSISSSLLIRTLCLEF